MITAIGSVISEDAVCDLLQTTLEVGEDECDVFDVDMFVHDVINGYDWSGYTDPDDPINFITGVMKWCCTEAACKAYSTPGLVVIFNELQDWAYKFWKVDIIC